MIDTITITVTFTNAQLDEVRYAIARRRECVRNGLPGASPHRAADLLQQDQRLAHASDILSRAAGMVNLARINAMNARAAYTESDVPAWMQDAPVELD